MHFFTLSNMQVQHSLTDHCSMMVLTQGWGAAPAWHLWRDHELLQQHQPIQVRSTTFSWTPQQLLYSEVPSPQGLLDLSLLDLRPPPSVGLSPRPLSAVSPQTPSTASPVLAQTQLPNLPTLSFVPQPHLPPPLLPPPPRHHLL